MGSNLFLQSTNIVRDLGREMNYITTDNSRWVYREMVQNYAVGVHSFNIVGSYGTGKSSFLWALERHLNRKHNFFSNEFSIFEHLDGFEFFPLVGDYASLMEAFADKLGINSENITSKGILRALDEQYARLKEANKGLLVVVDEFGKFLEYASQNNPEKELYFIQLFAEYVNDPSKDILFVTALHQNFNAYAVELSKHQQYEWDKVKGRLKEITFNEPVEQLLYLASERLQQLELNREVEHFDELFRVIVESKCIQHTQLVNPGFARSLLPFDLLSAMVLTKALQEYGQNERSLFSFIESNDYLSIRDFDAGKSPYYTLSSVYDYLLHDYYSYLTTRHNPHFNQWLDIRDAIERAEGILTENVEGAVRIIKAIGLLNLFVSGSATIDFDFVKSYARYALNIEQPEEIITALENHKIILYAGYARKYRIFKGTDIDIPAAIREAEVPAKVDVVSYLNEYFDLYPLQAKEYFYEKGTSRFFVFKLTDSPWQDMQEMEGDGVINLIFSDTLTEAELQKVSADCREAVLFCYYKNTKAIRELLTLILKIEVARKTFFKDKVAAKEFEEQIFHYKQELNSYVKDSLFRNDPNLLWYYQGERVVLEGHKALNRLLSRIAVEVYPDTPVFKNESVNKSRLSSQMSLARKVFLKMMVNNPGRSDFGIEKFPPEKSIYRSLLSKPGIHIAEDGRYRFSAPTEPTFRGLWDYCLEFIDYSKSQRTKITVLIEQLKRRPWGMKQGFIDLWIPVFLYLNRDRFALFDEYGYIAKIDAEILDLISKRPSNFEIKGFDISGVRLELFNCYRALRDLDETDRADSTTFIELIRPYLAIYRSLNTYARRTNRISKKAKGLREAIAKSTEPEKTFFEDIPEALGYTVDELVKHPEQVDPYLEELDSCIVEIQGSYDELMNRVESFVLNEIVGEKLEYGEYRRKIQERYKNLKEHLLQPKQKRFYIQIKLDLSERNAWFEGFARVLLGHALNEMADEDEAKFYELLKDAFHELDELNTLSREDINPDKEEVFSVEVSTFRTGTQKKTLRLMNNSLNSEMEEEIKRRLPGGDRNLRIALLVKLLQEELKNG